MKEVVIDVSALPAPEPMQQIIAALAQLNAEQVLKVIHRRQPFPLFEQLLKSDWEYQCDELSNELFHIYIFKKPVKTRLTADDSICSLNEKPMA